uniref:Uncharacterized protein n=1 Tax=Arundo donax TaxID=35708 RepID=A0A0A8ZJC8_ARUDO
MPCRPAFPLSSHGTVGPDVRSAARQPPCACRRGASAP